jgi:hypothetical protein
MGEQLACDLALVAGALLALAQLARVGRVLARRAFDRQRTW